MCKADVRVAIISRGEGATIDGQGKTRLFRLRSGCSLTLQGLALINGRADADEDGGLIHAVASGDIQLINTSVRNCLAGSVGC